jgi:hypothetical protein
VLHSPKRQQAGDASVCCSVSIIAWLNFHYTALKGSMLPSRRVLDISALAALVSSGAAFAPPLIAVLTESTRLLRGSTSLSSSGEGSKESESCRSTRVNPSSTNEPHTRTAMNYVS